MTGSFEFSLGFFALPAEFVVSDDLGLAGVSEFLGSQPIDRIRHSDRQVEHHRTEHFVARFEFRAMNQSESDVKDRVCTGQSSFAIQLANDTKPILLH